MLRTVDTDVVVISVASFHKLKLDKLWIAFGTGKHFRYLAIHEIVNTLGPDKSTSLLLFHALTGCDTVSSFSTKGKKSAYETWTDYPALTDAFLELSVDPASVSNCRVFAIIQRFVVLLYERTSAAESVDVCRKHLFCPERKVDGINSPYCRCTCATCRTCVLSSCAYLAAMCSKLSFCPKPIWLGLGYDWWEMESHLDDHTTGITSVQ